MLARTAENRAADLGPAKFSWWKDWRGECVAIVASGPSACESDVAKLRDRIHVVCVNDSFQLCPWAEVLYACDANWWKLHRGAPEFSGLKLTQDSAACSLFPDVNKIELVKARSGYSEEIVVEAPGIVGGGGNSGFQLTNVVTQFGATGIFLIGFDFQGTHWHGRHPPPLSNPDEGAFRGWRRVFDAAAAKFRSLGVDVVNGSPTSTLTAYPKLSIPEALERWGL